MKSLFSFFRNLIAALLPREERFFDLFLEMLDLIKEAINHIQKAEAVRVNELAATIEDLEDKSDFIEYTIKQRLKSSITTPPQLNRESILELASTIDNIMDSLKSVTKRLQSGKGEIITILRDHHPEYWQMLDKLMEATVLNYDIIRDFSENRIDAADPRLKRVHDIENEIDTLHIFYITERLYNTDMTGKDMVIMTVIGRIEGAGDELQRLVKIIEGVLVSG